MKKIGTRGALIKLFQENKSKKLSLEEIYELFPKYYSITSFMKQNSPSDHVGRPRYKNYVRSALYTLVKEGIIEKRSYNCYYYSKNLK
jgi:hypothetical protein